MRIRKWVVTGAAATVAWSALAIIVSANDPFTAEPLLRALFWVALGLGLWALGMTLFLWLRCNLAQAMWMGFWLACAGLGVLLLYRSGVQDRRLLGGVIFATLLVSLYLWFRFRDK